MSITVRTVEYQTAGQQFVGTLATPTGNGPHPGVLIAHEGGGLDQFQRDRARLFAELGFEAFALDYHGEAAPFASAEAMIERRQFLLSEPGRLAKLGAAGLEVFLERADVDPTRVAAIGFCLGGTLALELARGGAHLRAVIGIHPGLFPVEQRRDPRINGSVLLCVGRDDPFVTAAQLDAFAEEMSDAGVDWQMHIYGGVRHSFSNPRAGERGGEGLAYDAQADRRAWRATLDLLEETIGNRS